MDQNSLAIQVICSHLATNSKTVPYEPKEWSDLDALLTEKKIEPKDLLTMNKEYLQAILQYDDEKMSRINLLLERSPALSFEISDYENMGIHFVTKADDNYPNRLLNILGKSCPPIFCYAGDLSILERDAIGFVGSRSINEKDLDFTKEVVSRTIRKKYAIVSGGAKGTDSVALNTALEMSGYSIAFLSDSLTGKLKLKEVRKAVQEGYLLLISAVKPNASWNVGNAMARNKYIYAQSKGTVVVKSDFNTGGTWSGATECLRNHWVPVYCWDNKSYKGNQALIEKGAINIDSLWNCEINSEDIQKVEKPKETAYQMSIFDFQ